MIADFSEVNGSELVVVSAADDEALVSELGRIAAFIDRVPDARLIDIAYTCSMTEGDAVAAFVVRSVHELRDRLVSARTRIGTSKSPRISDRGGTYYRRSHLCGTGGGKLAFIYPGVMGYYPDMMRELVVLHPECRAAFDELEEAMSGNAEFTPSNFIFPPAQYYRHDADIFASGAYAQALVATFSGCMALTWLLDGVGIVPDGIVGCAGGDLAAVVRSGAAGTDLQRQDRIRAIRDIYGLVGKAVNHSGLEKTAMVTVIMRHEGDAERVIEGFPPGKVMLAIDLSPRRKTYAVATDFEESAITALKSAGVHVAKLGLDRPFNTEKCASLVPVVRKFAANWMKYESVCEVYSCATASLLPRKAKPARNDTSERWAKPVRFTETVRAMHDAGYRVFVEVGPKGMMTSAVVDSLQNREFAAVALDLVSRRGRLQIQHALGQLAADGVKITLSREFARRRARRLDFDSAILMELRKDAEMRLSRSFPRLTLLGSDRLIGASSFLAEPKGRGVKAAQRAAAIAAQARRQRQLDFGAVNPLVSDADVVGQSPGVWIEVVKCFRLADIPFLADFALGTSQLSYTDPNLRGLVLLTVPSGTEIMAETAKMVVPNRELVTVDGFVCRRQVAFANGELKLRIRAERVASADKQLAAVKVQLREDSPDSTYTWPFMEAVFTLAGERPPSTPMVIEPLAKPRSVHWSDREIYPVKLCRGKRLRGIRFVETWSESGLDYEVVVPSLAGTVLFTRFPMWVVDPLLLEVVTSGFSLWRSHEKFAGAFSLPFRMRRLELKGAVPKEGAILKCYMRLSGVTPKSHLCNIVVTDGNGGAVMEISGWEELTERIPIEYRNLIMQPALSFLSAPISEETLGNPSTEISSAFITDVPYPLFERNEELWLKTMSHIVLCSAERDEFLGLGGSTARRTEWLFGRIVAKEAVRRFLKDHYQARWSDADIQIWRDDLGKPHPLGGWGDNLTSKLDIAIAHTAQFVVAVVAANARVGVDVESVSRDLSEEFTNGVFTPDELELASLAANASRALLRFWCAKEAVSKMLGTGIRYSPREMCVTEYQADADRISVRLEGSWLEAFKKLKGRDIPVISRVMRDHALAFCFMPASLFDEG